jgi:membrane protein DedA with SNARE-associated domain
MTEALPWPVNQIAGWMPLWQAAGFFFATFVLEDVATIGAGLLLATGAIGWPVAFGACFPGVWLGDAGLYAAARLGGRKWFEHSRLRRFADKVARSERWFAKRGTPILVFSRMLPGTRLPTYLAAGFLRVPLPRFLLITGLASLIWTLGILLLAQAVGVRVLAWLGIYKQGAMLVLLVALLVWGGFRLLGPAFTRMNLRRLSASLGRWLHWEFWPPWLFYPPVGLYYLWLAARHRGLMLPTSANPGIFAGGIVGESKMATLCDLMATSPEFTAEAELLAGATLAERLASLDEICARRGFSHPFILKPDVGQRGAGVKLIRSPEQARAYLQQSSAPLLVQRYAPGPYEAGIFYYRFPNEARGRIFSITEKIFPVVIGDGQSTVTELVYRDSRARFLADKYLKRFAGRDGGVPAAGETVKLVEAGNHAQGCIFQDGARLATPALVDCVDAISQKLTGFFIGRFDIRYASQEDLRAGRNFQIIELNGASSEASSIYDARYSLLAAYRTLFCQWELVFAIGAANRGRGCVPARLSLVWRKWREYSRLAATYPAAD